MFFPMFSEKYIIYIQSHPERLPHHTYLNFTLHFCSFIYLSIHGSLMLSTYLYNQLLRIRILWIRNILALLILLYRLCTKRSISTAHFIHPLPPYRFTNKFFFKFCVVWKLRNQVQVYFCLFLFLFSEDLDRYWEDTQKLNKNVRPPPLFYKVNIFVIFV